MKTPDGIELVKGIGATLHVGSDRYPYTVTDFSETGKTLTLVPDTFTPDVTGGHDYYGTQKYVYTPGNPDALTQHPETARWSRRFKSYRIAGHGGGLSLGERDAYIDCDH